MSYRDCAKRAVHAADYYTTPRTLASAISVPIATAEAYLHYWCEEENPEIGHWKRRIRRTLHARRMPVIHNAFGFRRMYTDRPDRLLGQALAWIAQSTVSLVINHALVRIDAELCEGTNWGCRLLSTCCTDLHASLQVHDSILMQAPRDVWPAVASAIQERMAVTVPYADPLIIPSELKWSPHSWGHMEKYQT
jgi:DNA polymerase I-like protein with 3'-5' exonuclease and polymerase domains